MVRNMLLMRADGRSSNLPTNNTKSIVQKDVVPDSGTIPYVDDLEERPSRGRGHGRSASRNKTEPIFEQMFY